MTSLPDLDDARWQIRSTLDAVAAATRIEVHLGRAHETYPPTDAPPLAVIDDPAAISDLLRELSRADPSARTVAHALDGLSLVFLAPDDDYLGSVQLLSPHWIRGLWTYDAHLPGGVLADVVARLENSPWDPRADEAVKAALSGSAVTPAPHARWLAGAWDGKWSGQDPISYLLRANARWVRFHSLPQSQRYPDDEAQYAELLLRHRTTLEELATSSRDVGRDVIVVTASWSASSSPVPQSAPVAAALPHSQYWMSVCTDEDPEFRTSTWTHLFFADVSLDDPALEQLLRIVADDQTSNVLILAPDLSWLYAPYDGGADVYPATLADREALIASHPDWLPFTASGL